MTDYSNKIFKSFETTGKVMDQLIDSILFGGLSVDKIEDQSSVRILVDVPGCKKEDIKLNLNENTITVEAAKPCLSEGDKVAPFLYSERPCGKLIRTIAFSGKILSDQVKATYDAGVLDIRMPKDQRDESKQIHISE
eukprot:TRINITY_DN1059_c0_g1_i1.p1 TRINITY_DN1059_c0_g1~~TRINITY_DN1059_c0_g1_i1.p1  ORF type:complete len:137 (-),score=20.94 TRINITY_DN1059_c0_g1_i1:78-488(-)